MIWYGWVRGVSSHLQADVDCSTGTVPLIHEKIYDLTWLDDLSVAPAPSPHPDVDCSTGLHPPHSLLNKSPGYPFNFRENICFGMVDWALWVGFRFLLFSGRCWLFRRAASSTLLLSSLMTLSLYLHGKIWFDMAGWPEHPPPPSSRCWRSRCWRFYRAASYIFYFIPVLQEKIFVFAQGQILIICQYFKLFKILWVLQCILGYNDFNNLGALTRTLIVA